MLQCNESFSVVPCHSPIVRRRDSSLADREVRVDDDRVEEVEWEEVDEGERVSARSTAPSCIAQSARPL